MVASDEVHNLDGRSPKTLAQNKAIFAGSLGRSIRGGYLDLYLKNS